MSVAPAGIGDGALVSGDRPAHTYQIVPFGARGKDGQLYYRHLSRRLAKALNSAKQAASNQSYQTMMPFAEYLTLFEAARAEAANFSSDGLQHMTAMAQTIGRRGGQHSQFMFKITTGDLMLKLLGHLAEYIKLPSHVLGHDVLFYDTRKCNAFFIAPWLTLIWEERDDGAGPRGDPMLKVVYDIGQVGAAPGMKVIEHLAEWGRAAGEEKLRRSHSPEEQDYCFHFAGEMFRRLLDHYVRQELLKEEAGPARQVRFVARDGDACDWLDTTVQNPSAARIEELELRLVSKDLLDWLHMFFHETDIDAGEEGEEETRRAAVLRLKVEREFARREEISTSIALERTGLPSDVEPMDGDTAAWQTLTGARGRYVDFKTEYLEKSARASRLITEWKTENNVGRRPKLVEMGVELHGLVTSQQSRRAELRGYAEAYSAAIDQYALECRLPWPRQRPLPLAQLVLVPTDLAKGDQHWSRGTGVALAPSTSIEAEPPSEPSELDQAKAAAYEEAAQALATARKRHRARAALAATRAAADARSGRKARRLELKSAPLPPAKPRPPPSPLPLRPLPPRPARSPPATSILGQPLHIKRCR